MKIHKLSTKLLIAFLAVGLIPFAVIGTIALITAQNALTFNTMSHLESVRDAKKMYIQHFFKTQLGNVRTLAEVGSVVTATEMMAEAFHITGGTIENNAIWGALSERYTPAMKNYIDTQGYKDLYIISTDGDIVYSVTGKSDLGQNVREGKLRKSSLGRCFTHTLKNGMALTDFELYEPHNNDPALFAGAVVKRGHFVSGVVVIYIPIEMINRIMLERSGLGRTGETYLVGNDMLMRSNLFLDPARHSVKSSLTDPERNFLDTEAVHLALGGQTGRKIIHDFRGVQVVSAFTPLRFGDMTWALIAEIDKSEAFAPVEMLRLLMSLVALTGISAIVFVSFLIARRISRPLGKLTKATEEISQGRFEAFLDSTLLASSDEIGLLAKSFHTMTAQLKRSMADSMKEISERKRLTTILDSTTDMVSMATPDARITYMNKAGLKLLGWRDTEEISSRTISDAHPDWAFDIIEKTGIPAAIENGVWTGETTLQRGDGSEMPVSQVIMSHKSPEGELQYLSTIIRDISGQKRLEARLQRAQKMEALGILAGGVAHDINNVLSGIVSYPDLLLMQIPKDSPLRKIILTIQESGKKAADIVQDLLTMARRGVVVENVVNLNIIISEYLKNPEYEKLKSFHPNVTVQTNLEPGLFNITGSDVHLAKTVMNLVSNAAEAMPDGGRISITTENRYVDSPISGYDSFEEGDYATLMVSDTGIGINPEDRERIFEPFYTKKVMGRSGTGLGMAVVWGTVKDHKGHIDLQSKEGNGTVFTLYFPATRQAETQETVQLPIESYMGKGESILVVDDVKDQREIAYDLLTSLGYAVEVVSSGENAVDYLKSNTVDLLLIDMIMDPGIDGLETYRRILEIRPGQKAVIASGFSETRRVKSAQKLGAGTYIKKPYTLEKLGITTRDELDK